MTKRLPSKLLVIAACLIVFAPVVGAQSKCRGPDGLSAGLVGELADWMTVTEPEQIADRDTLYRIPTVAASQVALVTASNICAKLVTAYAALPGKHTPSALYVVKLGTKGYAVHDPNDLAGSMAIVVIFDSKYKRIGGWTGP